MKKKDLIKKEYNKPAVEVVEVDHEISLVMMTGPPSDDDIPEFEAAKGVEKGPMQASSPSSVLNPFGGSSPDYDN